MIRAENRAERQDRLLDEMADLGMSFARKLEARVELVTSVDEAHALARAFDRVTRSARLAIALQNKLARDRLEIAKLERSAAQKAVERRKAQITAVLDREIFTDEADQDEADTLAERLTERLDAEALFDDFLNGPLDAAIARIRKDLGLPEVGAEEIDPPPGRSPIEGEVDRAERREPEGVETHSHLCGLQPPQSAALTAPPEGEHPGGPSLKPAPS